MSHAQRSRIRNIAIAKLRPHARQADVFGNVSDAEVRALANDMAKNGQREPIVILPDFTIISGHQRARALTLLGRATVRAIVRADLVGKDDEITRLFVYDNLNRRQLGPFGMARCFAELRDALRATPGQGQTIKSLEAEIVARFASVGSVVADRTLRRYVDLLELPRPIQDAIAQKRLSMRDGAAIRFWSKRRQQEIAAACSEGKSKAELANLMGKMRGKPQLASDTEILEAVGSLANLGRDRCRELAGHFTRSHRARKQLENAKTAVSQLLTFIYS